MTNLNRPLASRFVDRVVFGIAALLPLSCFADAPTRNPLGEPSSMVLVAIAVVAAAIAARWHRH